MTERSRFSCTVSDSPFTGTVRGYGSRFAGTVRGSRFAGTAPGYGSLGSVRTGSSLPELLVSLWLLGAILGLLLALIRTESRVAAHSADRAEALDAARTAAAVLSADAAPLDPIADIHGFGPDSLALRVFRGIGLVCAFAGSDPIVRYRGLRQPDPLKDSVLLITATPERTDSLRGAAGAAGACAALPGEEVFRIDVAASLAEGDALLFFEAGSYHLDGAFRYRRGAGGRQPVTPDLFAAASRFELLTGALGAHALRMELVPSASAGALRNLPLAPSAQSRTPFRNRAW